MTDFVVTTHYENGAEVGVPSHFVQLSTVYNFIDLMWPKNWANHFVVTGPGWKVIVRRKHKPAARTPQELQDGMPF